ncbi:HEAT repeat domain-containing protein [candidate division KSB1 bacterium]|nr:HEAT repeat domain-containing protein [candidate division KSB1 bacterium]
MEQNVKQLIEKLTKPNKYAKKHDIMMMETSAFAAEFIKRCNKVRQDAAAALVAIGPPAVDALMAQLKNDEQVVRVISATSLGVIGDANAVDALIKALNDNDNMVRSSAAGALGGIGDKRSVEPLTPLLEDNEYDVRKAAADAIGKITGSRPKVKGACFIATACYGSYNCIEVRRLCLFRDEVLRVSYFGRLFVNIYYRISPPFSNFLKRHQILRNLVKTIIIDPIGRLIYHIGLRGD